MAVRRIIADVEDKGLNPLKPHNKLRKGSLVGTTSKTSEPVVAQTPKPEPKPIPKKKITITAKATPVVEVVEAKKGIKRRNGLKELKKGH